MQYLVPSFGYTLLVSGVVALVWAIVRTMLAYFILRGEKQDKLISSPKPALAHK
jgi:hypothetical protein